MDKFGLLMWKNWKLQIRHPIQTIIEILVPIGLCCVVVLLRALITAKHHDDKFFTPYPPLNEGPLNKYDEIMFSPKTSEVAKIMEAVKADFPKIKFQGFDDQKTVLNNLVTANSKSKIGVVFDDGLEDNEALPNNINFILRFPSEMHKKSKKKKKRKKGEILNWQTNTIFPLASLGGSRDPENNFNAEPEYYDEGFLPLQESVSKSIIKYLHPDLQYPDVQMQRYPYPAHDEQKLLQIFQTSFGVFVLLGFMFNVCNITKYITIEKERQLKEVMKIMGLPNWLHWLAWFVKYLIFLAIVALVVAVLHKINFGNSGAVFPRSNVLLVFVFLLLYVCAVITFGFMMSSFSTSATIATSMCALVFFMLYVPYPAMAKDAATTPLGPKMAASLLVNTAMGFGFQQICLLELAGEGLQWNNIWSNVTPEGNMGMGHVYVMLIVDNVLYMLLALYIEAVFPGKYGVPKKWYFIFNWTTCCNRRVGYTSSIQTVEHDEATYEPEPRYLKPGVQISHLSKTYKGNLRAVDDLSVNMYEDQITVLLGHNGAGKTTTFSMITGLYPPTGGRMVINGYDVEAETGKVRASLGFCPQYNVLFDELTVKEHIYFFARVKGLRGRELNAEIDYYISLLKLEPKRNVKSAALSGGMKRKLSVAMAFCGKSKVVLLDEPTSGMDPAARRALWDVVESEKKGRTVLLSTHFMDEADVLGDRIAIMARGRLQCCGTSFFLKKKYGSGYLLILERTADCDVDGVTAMLAKRTKGNAKLRSNVGSELTYQLEESDRPVFHKIFADLEKRGERLGIVSYGVSLTTLEDVFLKVGSDTEKTDERNKHLITFRTETTYSSMLTGNELLCNQIKAMFLKRALTTIRSVTMILFMLLIPGIFLILGLLPSKLSNKGIELPKLKIDFGSYGKPVTLLCSSDANDAYYRSAKTFLDDKLLLVDDIGDRKVTDYMLKLTKDSPSKAQLRYISGACFEGPKAVGWVNNVPLHSPPLTLNLVTNTILRSVDKKREITVYNHPTPFTLETKLALAKNPDFDVGYAIGENLAFSFIFIAGFFVMVYVRERVCKAKHLQLVSGVSPLVFWSVSYVWDWLLWLAICLIVIIVVACFQMDGFKTAADIARLFVILLYSIFALMPWIYWLSFEYDTPSQGFVRSTMYFSMGVGLIMVYQILTMEPSIKKWTNIADWVFLFVPLYGLASGLMWTYHEHARVKFCENIIKNCVEMGKPAGSCRSAICKEISQCCSEANYYGWERPGILRNIAISLICGLVLLVLVLFREYKLDEQFKEGMCEEGKRKTQSGDIDQSIDDDVDEENRRVRSMTHVEIVQHSIVVRDLTKNYKDNFVAVDRLCLAVDAYECFGLLGVNGAGKTTTFKMITGDINVTKGDIYVRGLNIKTDSKRINKQTGYCPQFDALFDELTVLETMRIFCLIRGYHAKDIQRLSAHLASTFDLNKHMEKRVGNLSGGNKRKLSTAVAMIGDPAIIYLDEPTTGMDPATKRHLWNALCEVRDSGKSLVLTSHSMEECEALCTRLAIMVRGRFMCIGSLQHLKSKFSQGYTLTVKLKRSEDVEARLPDIVAAITEFLPDAVLKDHHHELVTFRLPGNTIPLSKMFNSMEAAMKELDIDDYSISQCGLEEVFLSFTTDVN